MAVTAKPRNRLTGLQIHAAAGVDHGANRSQMDGAEGWMVIKAAGPTKAATDIAAPAPADAPPNGHDVAKSQGGHVADSPTREALAKAVTDAQADLVKAQEAVAKSATDETVAAVAKASAALLAAVVAKSEADDERITELETAAAATTIQVSDEVDELQKALDDPATPEVLKAALRKQAEAAEDARKEAEEANKVAKAERDARVAKEFVAKAEGFDGLPGAEATKFGPVLRQVAEKCGDEVFASLETILRGASDTCKASDLLKEVGSSFAQGSGAGDAYAAITAKATEIRETAVAKGEDMTREQAIDRVYALHPELVEAYKKETR